MASFTNPISFANLLFWMSCFLLMITTTSLKQLCHNDESSALLQFKQSFVVDNSVSGDPSAYPKAASWKENETNGDCCLWDGVECDEETGHVIGLDLSSSFLYGSINSTSSLFQLVHLQRLNLGDNDFNFSEIPTTIKLLSRLTYLDLSCSVFSGQIPSEITELSKLTSIDLGGNIHPSSESPLLQLKISDMRRLIQNLTSLETLNLDSVSIASIIPHAMSNLSHLTSLNLRYCNLKGLIPSSLGDLTKLEYLNLGQNNISGHIPSSLGNLIHFTRLILFDNQLIGELPSWLSNLTQISELDISSNKLHGHIPESFSKLVNLAHLDLASNNFSGQISSWLANLTQLNVLRLSGNNFTHGTLSWLGKQEKLTYLGLTDINLVGQIPCSLKNLTHLDVLLLGGNQLTGPIPSWLSNLSQLTELELGPNQLYGSIPKSFSKLVNLKYLNLQSNQLNGTIKLNMFSTLKHLTYLHMVGNDFSLVTKIGRNATLPKFSHLGFANCNLREFPDFLRQQHELTYLNLAENKIHGLIPKWMGNVSRETLLFLFLADNFITNIEDPLMFSIFGSLQILKLSNNKLQGPLPIPPPSISLYDVSNHSLIGEISPLFCNIVSLASLDLSYNNLTGKVLKCLGNFTDSLTILNLANNFFHGSVPDTFTKGGSLRMIDLSGNGFGGQLPRTLANCRELEILDVSENHLCDKFPLWLATLQNLQVLSLRSNQFFDEMGSLPTANAFSKLRILDISCNNFTGALPTGFIQNLSSMKDFDVSNFAYMRANQTLLGQGDRDTVVSGFLYEIVFANKGIYLQYRKIPNVIAAIDLSSNRFQGEIPPSIGTLKMLNVLNLSNNNFSSHIPSVLGSLTKLESLDLSFNMLSGEIPLQLLELTFLEYFNVSHNQLMGRIPEGKQFNTFDNTSYLENSGLCGSPLSKKCDDSMASPPSHASSTENEDSSLLTYFGWKAVVLGYGCGLVVGVIFGHIFSIKKHEWLLKTSRIRQRGQNRRRELRRRH